MLIFISPAKNMKNHLSPKMEQPLIFDGKTKILINHMQTFSMQELQQQLRINDKLTKLNYDRYQHFYTGNSYAAIELFDGLVFKNLQYENLSDIAKKYLQKHLYIYSALYGILRPEDAIRPYRLDMDDHIRIHSENLYQFWNSEVLQYIKQKDKTIINLASKEYSKMIEPYLDETFRYITITFKVNRNNQLKTESTGSKVMRGCMLRYLAMNLIETEETIKEFHENGYQFREDLSSDKEWVFVKDDVL